MRGQRTDLPAAFARFCAAWGLFPVTGDVHPHRADMAFLRSEGAAWRVDVLVPTTGGGLLTRALGAPLSRAELAAALDLAASLGRTLYPYRAPSPLFPLTRP